MSYKTVLLHLNSGQHCEPIINAGVAIAERHGAHLIGVYVVPPVIVYMGVPIPAVVNSFHDDYHSNVAKTVEKKFTESTEGLPFTSEWRIAHTEDSTTITTISKMAHTSDLLIVGNDTSDGHDPLPGNQLEAIVTSTCRPTLIVPMNRNNIVIGENVLIGWDGTDESTRAVFDSLPLLKLSKNVTIFRVNPTGSERHHTFGSSSELVSTLARHDVNAELCFSNGSHHEIAAELFKTATESGADTIVMGAFGHSKVHGLLMGSVSGEVLRTMKIPVLMSH